MVVVVDGVVLVSGLIDVAAAPKMLSDGALAVAERPVEVAVPNPPNAGATVCKEKNLSGVLNTSYIEPTAYPVINRLQTTDP